MSGHYEIGSFSVHYTNGSYDTFTLSDFLNGYNGTRGSAIRRNEVRRHRKHRRGQEVYRRSEPATMAGISLGDHRCPSELEIRLPCLDVLQIRPKNSVELVVSE